MINSTTRTPSYRRHRASGQAVVTLSGRDIYLGPYGTKLSRDTYDRHVGEWLAAGRMTPRSGDAAALTVVELVSGFHKAVQPNRDDFTSVMKLLRRLYGRSPAAEFGPLALKAVRLQMVATGWKRKTVNQRVHCLRTIFRWGVEQEILEPSVIQSLDAVKGLRAGKTTAPESTPIEPVAVEHVAACVPFMAPSVRAMVELQLHTGMRPGELCAMRTGDIDTRGDVWVYTPRQHKTKHLGKPRMVAIGPQAIAVLTPFLLPDLQAFIFSPARADAERRAIVHAARKTPMSCGNTPGSNRLKNPTRRMSLKYTTATYRNAIEYATRRAFPVPADLARLKGEKSTAWRARLGNKWGEVKAWRKKHHWHPHQIRHAFGSNVRERFEGLDHVQAALGQSHVRVAEIYAKVNRKKAVEVAAAIG